MENPNLQGYVNQLREARKRAESLIEELKKPTLRDSDRPTNWARVMSKYTSSAPYIQEAMIAPERHFEETKKFTIEPGIALIVASPLLAFAAIPAGIGLAVCGGGFLGLHLYTKALFEQRRQDEKNAFENVERQTKEVTGEIHELLSSSLSHNADPDVSRAIDDYLEVTAQLSELAETERTGGKIFKEGSPMDTLQKTETAERQRIIEARSRKPSNETLRAEPPRRDIRPPLGK